jgi:hypothetical protein
MRITAQTREILAARRARRRLEASGFQEVDGGLLLELRNGRLWAHVVTATAIGPDGKSIWCKVDKQKEI